MSRHSRFVFFGSLLLTVLLVNLITPMGVSAQDETPPPVTGEVQPPYQETDSVSPIDEGEEPAATETPVIEEPVPTETPVVTETPVMEGAMATEVPAEAADNVLPIVAEELTVGEVLEAAPEDTEVVVLDENGEVLSLVSVEAAQMVQGGDPIWCPATATTIQAGVDGCTDPGPDNANYDPTSLGSLLNYLAAHQPNQPGVIWIEGTYDSATAEAIGVTSIRLDNMLFPQMSQYALTLQGGWTGDSAGTIDHGNPSTFDGDSLQIINWSGAVTLNDLEFYNTGATGLVVESSGDVELNYVTAFGNDWGALIDNEDGTGNVTVRNSRFNDNRNAGLAVVSNGDITLTNVVAEQNQDGAVLYTPQSITVEANSVFSNNSGNGLSIDWAGAVSLTDVTANNNGTDGGSILNCFPAHGHGWCPEDYEIPYSGLVVISDGNVTLSNVTANHNYNLGAFLDTCGFESWWFCRYSGNVFVNDSTFNYNGSGINYTYPDSPDFVVYSGGLTVYGMGEITLIGVTANDNLTYGVNLQMGYEDFVPGGDIILTDVTANRNLTDGLTINSFVPMSENVTILCSQFIDNVGFGIEAAELGGNWQNIGGLLTLNDVTFSGNTEGDYHTWLGSSLITSGACKAVISQEVFNKKDKSNPGLPLHIVPVGGGEEIKLDCNSYSGTRLVLPNGDQVTLPCPIRDHGMLTNKTAEQLPAPLNAPFVFASALDIQVNRGGKTVDRVNQGMTIDFMIPDGMQGKEFAILFWDEKQSKWVEVPGTRTGDGHFIASSQHTGVYVLVTK